MVSLAPGGPRLHGQPLTWLGAGIVIYAAVMLFAVLERPFGEDGFTAFMDISPIAAEAFAAGLAAWAGWRSAGRIRLAWWFLAAGFASQALADTVWAVYEVGLHAEIPTPSLADPFYLAMIPLVFAGILLLSSAARMFGHLRTALDASILLFALAAVVWDKVIQPSLAGTETRLAGTLVTSAYPAGDVVLVFAIVAAMRRQWTGRARIVTSFLAVGLLTASLADLGYAWMALNGTYETGSFIDLGWPVGFLLMGFAAAMHATWHASLAEEQVEAELATAVWRQIVPMVLSAALVVWLLARAWAGSKEATCPWWRSSWQPWAPPRCARQSRSSTTAR